MKRQIAAITLLTASLASCAVVQEKTIGESLDDASASSQIKSKLLSASARGYAEVDVEVTGSLVLLTGRVATEQEKVEADRIAWSVRTIDEVANEIEVMPDSSFLKNVNDEWITARVRSVLVGDAAIKSVNYNIETFNGVVYLLGIAKDEAELKRAAEHASSVKGVDRVVSYVKLKDRSAPPGAYSNSQQYGSQQETYVVPGPAPAQNPVSSSQTYEAPNDGYSYGEEVPYIDPLDNSAPNYDADGYVVTPSDVEEETLEGGYSDPYADPFGDN